MDASASQITGQELGREKHMQKTDRKVCTDASSGWERRMSRYGIVTVETYLSTKRRTVEKMMSEFSKILPGCSHQT